MSKVGTTGVAILERSGDSSPARFEATQVLGPVLIDSRLHGWIAELSSLFEFVWATTWHEMANDRLCEPLGIGEIPFVDFRRPRPKVPGVPPNRCFKLPYVAEWLGSRPAAWIDDSITEAVVKWAAARTARRLVIRTEKYRGVTPGHIARLLEFGRSFRDSSATSG
jgi:hypothetical protein